MHRCRPPRGLTLIELMVVMAVLAILALVTVPSFRDLLARLRVEGIGNELATDLQYARSEALRRNTAVALATNAGGTSYTIAFGANVLKTVTLPAGSSISAGTTVSFEPLRGLAQTATLTVAANGTATTLSVNSDPMGRVTLCSTGGKFKGYPTC
ncbi:MAG: GspH/FimT family pseudopilin [Burkholderiales bacterium]|nr:GspH/FimT family pseudopilin [Burkholderiales bacterium]